MPAISNKPFRVLTIDGGGIRGLYSAVVLHGIAQRVAKQEGGTVERPDVGRAFDMVVGTSTGAILATALAAGVALEEVIALYRDNAKKIFAAPTPVRKLRIVGWLTARLLGAANSPQPLKTVLESTFKKETVAQMYRRRGIALCVPTIDIESHKSWVWKTPHDRVGNRLTRDDDYALEDVCLASAAAPIVFPAHGVAKPNDPGKNVNWFVDGGLWANNPVLVGLVEALSFAPQDAPIELVSVSTCPPFKALAMDAACCNRGLIGWLGGVRTLEAGIDAQSWAYHYMTKALVAQFDGRVRYLRLTDAEVSTVEAPELRLDNPSDACIAALVKLGHRAVDRNLSDATTGDRPNALILDVFKNLPPCPERSPHV